VHLLAITSEALKTGVILTAPYSPHFRQITEPAAAAETAAGMPLLIVDVHLARVAVQFRVEP
jgi:hypothetical protein